MKKPFLFATVAAVYIVFIVTAIQTTTLFPQKENIAIPIVMLSLFVLSAAVMGFLFLSQPLQLFLENRKQEAMVFFAKTVGVFACYVVIFAILILVI